MDTKDWASILEMLAEELNSAQISGDEKRVAELWNSCPETEKVNLLRRVVHHQTTTGSEIHGINLPKGDPGQWIH